MEPRWNSKSPSCRKANPGTDNRNHQSADHASAYADAFLLVVFFPGAGGTLLPCFLASERPMAIACLRLVTFFPLRPLFSLPCFISSITFSTFFWLPFEYLAMIIFFG